MPTKPHYFDDLMRHRYSDSISCIISLYDDLLRPCKVIKHRLDQPLASAVDIFNEVDASVYVDVSCSKDGKIMLISKNSKSSSEVWCSPSADPSSSFKCIRPRREGVRYFVEHCEGWLYVMHNDGSRNFRVSRARVTSCGECGVWEDFIAEDSDGAVLEDMDM
jgi:oligopeptidase B